MLCIGADIYRYNIGVGDIIIDLSAERFTRPYRRDIGNITDISIDRHVCPQQYLFRLLLFGVFSCLFISPPSTCHQSRVYYGSIVLHGTKGTAVS